MLGIGLLVELRLSGIIGLSHVCFFSDVYCSTEFRWPLVAVNACYAISLFEG